MTSASELFSTRRSRFGRPDPDPAFAYSANRNFHQNNNRRHHNHHINHHNGHDLDGCDPLRRSPRFRLISPRASSHSEWVLGRLEQGGSQFVPSSSRENGDAVSSTTSRPANERLPGAVLLARARLLERLRGVSVNRHGGRASGNSQRDYIFGDDFRLVDAGDWGTEISTGSLARGSPSAESTYQTERLQFLQEKNQKPPGLSQEALDNLQLEIFSSRERMISRESSVFVSCKDSWDCSICLESFIEGDKLTRLPCRHRFHSACLDPWVRTCGDCPYCRRRIL
ncbi:hypothetical protein SLE2022_156730 [Rubroshorea leprosula]